MEKVDIKNLIKDKESKLKLLEYEKVDITDIAHLLGPITVDLMEQCYNHALEFHNYNLKTNRKYLKIEDEVSEQLKDLLLVKQEFIKFLLRFTKRTKKDFYTYIYAHQMSDNFYDQYLYRVLVASVKANTKKEVWEEHQLDNQVLNISFYNPLLLFANTDKEINIGSCNFNLEKPIRIINDDENSKKLNQIRKISKVMKDYPCQEFSVFHLPYKTSINNLVDNVEIVSDFEKPKQLIR